VHYSSHTTHPFLTSFYQSRNTLSKKINHKFFYYIHKNEGSFEMTGSSTTSMNRPNFSPFTLPVF
jgi:hypothetical protein